MSMRVRAGIAAATAAIMLVAGSQAADPGGVIVRVADASGAGLADAVVFAVPAGGASRARAPRAVAIDQVNKEFLPALTVVQTGTPISFPNNDTVRHHVYSFSQAKTFEIKLYTGVPTAPVVFDKPGIVTLGCNIHDWMQAWVLVVDTPHFAKSAAGGEARLAALPPGEYDVHVWHPRGRDAQAPQRVKIEAGASPKLSAVLNLAPARTAAGQ